MLVDGPNDGLVAFHDAVVLPGEILPIWGADHYLRTPQLSQTIYFALQYLFRRCSDE